MTTRKKSAKVKSMPAKRVSGKAAADVKGGMRLGATGRTRGRPPL